MERSQRLHSRSRSRERAHLTAPPRAGRGFPGEATVEETRPNVLCGSCSGRGHIEARDARCALCAEKHRSDKHRCPGKDQACAYGVASHRGPHTMQSSLYPKEKRPGRPPKGGGRRLRHHAAGRVQQRPPHQSARLRRWRCKPWHRTGSAGWRGEGLRAVFSLCLSFHLFPRRGFGVERVAPL